MVSGEAVMEHDDSAVASPLSAITEAFEDLSKKLREEQRDIRLDTFCEAASLVSILFRCLGLAFKFAELEYVAKVSLYSFFMMIVQIYNG